MASANPTEPASAAAASGSGREIEAKITRIFAAPRERVFAAWTRPEQLARWMCRTGGDGDVRVLLLDLRVGGGFSV